jgi:MoaA/NifB/PqqE/SkfB family radical SAM enzyme
MNFTVDIETTNRCNATCAFCPRDMTPHQGLMNEAVFVESVRRAGELREVVRSHLDAELTVTMCGLGEPLLHPRVPEFVRYVREAGFSCALSSNAALLDERTAVALLDAGLSAIFINAGEIDGEYEAVYKLPFPRTRDNVARFVAMARDRCKVSIVLVDHRADRSHLRRVKAYWRTLGVEHYQRHDLNNRGGSLDVEHMRYRNHPHLYEARRLLERGDARQPICGVPFRFLFIGYDGQYYLCSSDWEKQVPLGSVFDESFLGTMRNRLEHVSSREPICAGCCHDPVNRLADRLARHADAAETADGDVHAVAEALVDLSLGVRIRPARCSRESPQP